MDALPLRIPDGLLRPGFKGRKGKRGRHDRIAQILYIYCARYEIVKMDCVFAISKRVQQMKNPCVYMLADKARGTLYLGVTSDLKRRIYEHKAKLFDGFTAKNDIALLVWFEYHDSMECAIRREKSLKRWQRKWKCRLVETTNPEWKDLYAAV